MHLNVGKLPPALLAELLAGAPVDDPRVLVGPGVGLDCAVIDLGERLLVCKSDPVTFVTDAIGHYLVQVNANDIATTGAVPRWLLLTLLLPEGAEADLARAIMGQVGAACRALNIALVGGHTEVTYGLSRPIAVGSLLGEVERERLVTPRGARPGDRLLLTKGVPIEGTTLLAREFGVRLRPTLDADELAAARNFLFKPGLGVLPDARLATGAGRVTAMHDPTEGGLLTALAELAEASGRGLRVDLSAVPVPDLSARICRALGADPLATIASGALLLTVTGGDVPAVKAALAGAGIACAEIGEVLDGPARVEQMTADGPLPVVIPERDEVARLFAGD